MHRQQMHGRAVAAMKHQNIYKTLLLVIAFALIGVYLYSVLKGVDYDYALQLPVIRPHGIVGKSCDNLSDFINSAVRKANYCATDEDCMVSDVAKVPCNCWSLVNKSADLAVTQQILVDYQQQQCDRSVLCEPCATKPMQAGIACQNNVCVTKNIATILYIPSVLHPLRESGIHSTERSDTEIITLFQKTNEIWKQAGIIFEATVEEARTIDNSAPLTIGVYPFMAPLVNAAKQNTVHVYFVRELAGANGWMVGERHIVVADKTTVDDFRTVAHEIGHLLGLGHSDDTVHSLMASGYNGTTLSETEIETARTHARAWQF